MPAVQRVYIAVIADIVASRSLPQRAVWQRKLEEYLGELNSAYKENIASKFIVTLGDEFQGLLHAPDILPDIWRTIDVAAFPFYLRLSIGCGTLETALKPRAVGMDGPAFHRARQGLDVLKSTGGLLHFATGDQSDDLALNSIAMLRDAIRAGWTKRQRDIYRLYRNAPSQRDLAENIHVSPSAVSRMLKRMHAQQLDKAEHNLIEIVRGCLAEQAGVGKT